jgi:hypothetical protein
MLITNKLAIIVTMLFLASSAGLAEESGTVSTLLTKKQARALEGSANTPQEHLSLSTYYHGQARKFEEKVQYHEEMAEIYRKNPLPFDGKMVVPMQRHCKDAESYYTKQAEQAVALATYHEEKAGTSDSSANTFARPSRWGLRSTGFDAPPNLTDSTPQQSSLFHDSAAATARFYDLTRILTYFVSAKGEPSIEMPELRKAATVLFDTQQQFFQSLGDRQKTAINAQLRTIDKLRRNVERELDRLGDSKTFPTSNSYFNAAKGMKGSLENWHNQQQEIAQELGIKK